MKQQHLQLAVDASRHGQKPTPFGVVEGESPMFAAAQLTIAREAWQCVSDALASRRGVEGPRTDAFEMALQAHFTQGLPTGLWMDAAWLKSVTGKREPADFGLAAWRSFVGSYVGWCARLKLPGMVVPLPRQIDDALVMQVLEEAGCAAVPAVDRGLDGLRLAWDTAQRNVERSEFRYAAAHTLASAARCALIHNRAGTTDAYLGFQGTPACISSRDCSQRICGPQSSEFGPGEVAASKVMGRLSCSPQSYATGLPARGMPSSKYGPLQQFVPSRAAH